MRVAVSGKTCCQSRSVCQEAQRSAGGELFVAGGVYAELAIKNGLSETVFSCSLPFGSDINRGWTVNYLSFRAVGFKPWPYIFWPNKAWDRSIGATMRK